MQRILHIVLVVLVDPHASHGEGVYVRGPNQAVVRMA